MVYPCAMVPEGTPAKWSLWATHPKRLGGIAELYVTEASCSVRATALRLAGYKVEIIVSRTAFAQQASCLNGETAR